MITTDLRSLATPVADLRTLEGNPRRGDVDAIARSLAAFGQRKPVVAARRTGEVIAGNHTLLAARALGWSELAVVWVDDDETTAHAYALADNRTAELGGYDDAALARLVAEVHEADAELLAAAGWEGDDLDALLRQLEPDPPPVTPRPMPDGPGATVMRADALALPLRAGSVDLIVTSPPYFALRSYQDAGGHYAGQLGSEPTPGDFLAALWAVMDECWRVLAPGGSAWINLGDKYAGSDHPNNNMGTSTLATAGTAYAESLAACTPDPAVAYDVADKSLLGLPWRFALGLICPDQYRPGGGPAWTLRAEVIWAKPNGLPESVTDRVRRSHEQWFHLTKGPRYFAALDEVREAQLDGLQVAPPPRTSERAKHRRAPDDFMDAGFAHKKGGFADYLARNGVAYNPLGKVPGSVWSIPSAPLVVPDDVGVDHFAAFSPEWPRRIIDGWAPAGICTACGEGRRPAVDKRYLSAGFDRGERDAPVKGRHRLTKRAGDGTQATITGYRCGCEVPDAPTRPAVVLDPFGGTGTVAMMARAMGRYGVHVERSAEYNRLARWRIFESGHAERCLAKAEGEGEGDG